MHHEAYAFELDYQGMSSAHLGDVFEPKYHLIKPHFVIQLKGATDETERSFSICHAANQTFWKYYILGDLAKRKLYIADLDHEI